MPIIGLIIPGVAWQNIVVGPFLIGSFIGAVITFAIIAVVIFVMVKGTSKAGVK